MRSPLDGGVNRDYTWNEWDRMTICLLDDYSKGVGYYYDAGGRLLMRQEVDLNTFEYTTTMNYWLGLNKIAEE
ncbi:hypothetical protein HY256_04295, partial [Candidatus Sumerlaeota bacterium]|nr:hypothetical protein [Candidatus Sumerlaeota bacterium]